MSDKIACTFVSEWDDIATVRTKAEYDPKEKTFEVLEVADVSGLDYLQREYLELPDGDEIEVCRDCHEGVMVTKMVPGIGRTLVEMKSCNKCGDE